MVNRTLKILGWTAAALLFGCSHPIEIIGQGDVMSASGTRNCSLQDFNAGRENCTKNLVVGGYQETYYAEADEGWSFSHWLNYCTDTSSNQCQFDIPAATVQQNWNNTYPPLVAVFKQDPTTQYPYGLPDPLIAEDGARVTRSGEWYQQRRPETLGLFATHIYGKTPSGAVASRYSNIEIDENALGGTAIRKQIRVVLSSSQGSVAMEVLLYLPKIGNKPHPVFLALNFNGNHTITSDPAIRIPQGWVEADDDKASADNKASASDRGMKDERWPLAAIIARGYGVATVYYGDLDPDYDDGFRNGVHPLFYSGSQSRPAADQWGAIGAWAWGLSRTMDYLIDDADVDNNRIAVMGFSRLGKSALWAAAQDSRIALAISNNSGTLGASLSRREGIASGKEPLSRLIDRYGYWFARNLAQYSNNPGLLPVDQHQLIALIAPRPVYIASAQDDLWADPRGEFEAGVYAREVYKLLGKTAISTTQLPALNSPLTTTVGYHIRSGEHDVTDYDWQRFMDFADRYMSGG